MHNYVCTAREQEAEKKNVTWNSKQARNAIISAWGFDFGEQVDLREWIALSP